MPTKIRAAVEDFMMQNDMSETLEEYLASWIRSPYPHQVRRNNLEESHFLDLGEFSHLYNG